MSKEVFISNNNCLNSGVSDSDLSGVPISILRIQNSEYISAKSNNFSNSGAKGVSIIGSKSIMIDSNNFAQCGSAGVSIIECFQNIKVTNNTLSFDGSAGVERYELLIIQRDNVLTNLFFINNIFISEVWAFLYDYAIYISTLEKNIVEWVFLRNIFNNYEDLSNVNLNIIKNYMI